MFPVSIIGHSLRLLPDAQFDEDHATDVQLNAIYDAIESVFHII